MKIGDSPGVSIYGNCQADALLKVLLQAPDFENSFSRQDLPACFAVEAPRLRSWAQDAAPSVGLFIHQRLRRGWRADEVFDTAWLSGHLPANAHVLEWSDMYYKGYEPYMSYPITFPRVAPDDYLNLLHVLVHVHGRPWQDVLPLYTRPDFLPEPLVHGIQKACAAELARREDGCSIQIAPFLESDWHRKRMFLTFNHPARPVMRYAAMQVLEQIGLSGPIPEQAWYAFPDTACLPLTTSISRLLEADYPDPIKSAFLLGNQNVTMEAYFEKWEAAFAQLGTAKLLAELVAQAQDRTLVAPVLEHAARILGLGDPLVPPQDP